jgi:hypothetical protein
MRISLTLLEGYARPVRNALVNYKRTGTARAQT